MKITDGHRKAQELRHIDPEYGQNGAAWAPLVSQIVNRMKITELLDYGCGKARLFGALKADHEMKLQAYDPAVPGFAGEPIPMQMVTCIDVLEHVEPECLDAVLDDLVRVTSVIGFFTVAVGEDGKPLEWWVPKLMSRFDLHTLQATPQGFYAIVYARAKPLIETLQ